MNFNNLVYFYFNVWLLSIDDTHLFLMLVGLKIEEKKKKS